LAAGSLVASQAGAAERRAKAFPSAEAAADALAAAWRTDNRPDLLTIFGSAGTKLVISSDHVAEKEARERLAAEFAAQHTIEYPTPSKAVLVIGKDEFPYPIPLVKQSQKWRFDTLSGEQEIINRRIGHNEINAIEVCRAYVEAQREYEIKDHRGDGVRQYARRLSSSAGKHDGLYWAAGAPAAGSPAAESPFGPLIAKAEAEGYSTSSATLVTPFHGYHFRILTKQGASASGGALDYMVDGRLKRGFALIAYPAIYGDSGVMTFLVNQHGIVFEKNLGPHTQAIAKAMTEYNPDKSWRIPATPATSAATK